MDTYTHGHAEPVLQSHRWRTAENSAGYLLPVAAARASTCSTSAAARARSPSTWPPASRPAGCVGIDVSADPLAEARAAAERAGVAVTFEVGDVYALAADDDSFDVVHAHQVLQHLTDPVAALREMARVCRPGGVIAVRDVDYGAFVTFPADDGLDRWLDLYHRVARRNEAEPDAGRRLLSWAHAAGLRDVVATTSSWCYRVAGRAAVVGRLVGRAGDGVVVRRAGGGLRAGDARRAGRRSPRPGCAGATPTTAGSACCTANCSSASTVEGPSWP